MLKGLFAALAGSRYLRRAANRPDGAAGSLQAGGEAASAPSQVSDPAGDGGLGLWIPADGGPIHLGEPPGSVLRPQRRSSRRRKCEHRWLRATRQGTAVDEMKQLRSRIRSARAAAGAGTRRLADPAAVATQRSGRRAPRATRAGPGAQGGGGGAREQARELTQKRSRRCRTRSTSSRSATPRCSTRWNPRLGRCRFPAQEAVQYAREAVEREDLAEARYWLSVAISEVQRAQLSH